MPKHKRRAYKTGAQPAARDREDDGYKIERIRVLYVEACAKHDLDQHKDDRRHKQPLQFGPLRAFRYRPIYLIQIGHKIASVVLAFRFASRRTASPKINRLTPNHPTKLCAGVARKRPACLEA